MLFSHKRPPSSPLRLFLLSICPFGLLAASQVVLWLLMPNRFSFHSFQKFLNGRPIPGPNVFPFRGFICQRCVCVLAWDSSFYLSFIQNMQPVSSAGLFHKSNAACFFYTLVRLHVYCTMYKQLFMWSSCRRLIRIFNSFHCYKNQSHIGCFNVTCRNKMWDFQVCFDYKADVGAM